MAYETFAAVACVKLILAFLFFFVYLPTRIFPQTKEARIDRFVENFVLMASTAIIFVHVLAVGQIYSIFALFACYGLLCLGLVWRRERAIPLRRIKTFWTQKVIVVFNMLDHVIDVRAAFRERIQRRLQTWRDMLTHPQDVLHATLFLLILGYSAILRYADLFQNSAFAFSDPYSHLLWMKQLESGVPYPEWDRNQYYPKGFHAFAAVLHGLTGVDGAMTIRLVGPLVGVLLVLGVYYVGRRLTESREAALVGMLVYGTFVAPILLALNSYFEDGEIKVFPEYYPQWFARQTAALPEEFALIFLMPALYAAYAYLTGGRSRHLIVFALASIALFMSHPLVSAALAVGLAVLGFLSLVTRSAHWKTLATLAGMSFATAFLGNLQLLYGWLFDRSVSTAVEHYRSDWLGSFESEGILPYTLEIGVSAVIGLLVFCGGLVLARDRKHKLLWSFFGLYLLTLVFLGRSVNFRVRYLISPDRLDFYRVFLLSGALSGFYYGLTSLPMFKGWYRKARWVYPVITAMAIACLSFAGSSKSLDLLPKTTFRYEYDSFSRISYRIKSSFAPLQWTVVSTTEYYSKVFKDGGWHVNVATFLSENDPYDRDLNVPTPYIFLFVEKRPFQSSSDPSLNNPGVRLDLHRRLQEWCNIYNLFHNDLSIYYEDWDVIVYLLTKGHITEGTKGFRSPSEEAIAQARVRGSE